MTRAIKRHPSRRNVLRSFRVLLLLVSIFLFLFNGTFLHQIQAENRFSMIISPTAAYLKIKPGTEATHTVTVTNNSAKEITVTPRIFDSKPADDTSFPQLQTTFSFPYLTDQAQGLQPFTIKAGESYEYKLHFAVPEDASDKEYPLTLLFSKVIEGSEQGTVNLVQPKLFGVVGSNIVVLISNAETLPNGLRILDVKSSPWVDSLRSIHFRPIVFNQGVQTVQASGSAQITDMFHKTVFSTQVYPDVVLGGQKRTARALIPGDVTTPPQPTEFTYNPIFLLGPYKINITLFDEQGNTLHSYTKTAFALPYAIIIALLTTVLGVILARKFRKQTPTAE